MSPDGIVQIEVAEEEFAAAIVATMWALGWRFSYRVSLRSLPNGAVGQRHRIGVPRSEAVLVSGLLMITRKRDRLVRKGLRRGKKSKASA